MSEKPPEPPVPPTVAPAPSTNPAASSPRPTDSPTPGLAETRPETGLPLPSLPLPLPAVPGYEVLGEVGRGGMGVVYKAKHLALKRVVALKMVLAGDFAGASELARFKAEAEAVARLQHPNIVQIYDVGEAAGHPFCALEFVDGGSLAQRLAGNPPTPRQAAELVQALARAMDLAHARGIVHRDLKPANVLLAFSDASQKRSAEQRFCEASLTGCVPKITDFGLARQLDSDSGQTHAGQVMGTPSYMAPEQASGLAHEAGPPADVWALGAILYECLVGQPPFRGRNVEETLEQVRSQEPVHPRRLKPTVPRDLETICLKCLRKEPQKRYASAAELADDLQRFLNFEPIRARRVGALERSLKWARRRPATVLAALVAILLLLGAPVGYLLWREREKEHLKAEEERRKTEDLEAKERQRTERKVEYRPSVIQRRGVPEGSGRLLTPEQAQRRAVTYRITRRGDQVERVDVLNGHGAPTSSHPYAAVLQPGGSTAAHRECSFRFLHDSNGNFIREEAYDRNGQKLWSFHIPAKSSVGWYLDAFDQLQQRSAAGASHLRYAWDKDGLAKEIRFLNEAGEGRPDDNGVYGMRLEYDGRGRMTRGTYLGPQGQPAVNREGVASLRLAYDDDGNISATAVFDLQGKPAQASNGAHRATQHFDDDGNPVELALFDGSGAPVLGRDGYHRVRGRFNRHGDLIETTFFGTRGESLALANGVQRWGFRCDDRGNRIEEESFGLAGQRVGDAQGVARRTFAHNDRGDLVDLAVFGTDNRPLLLPQGYHRSRARYDDHGRPIEWAYFGSADEAVRLPVKNEPPRNDLALNAAQPQPPEAGGYHKLTQRYDKAGRVTELVYFGVRGEPVTIAKGFHREVRSYGAALEVSYFDTAGGKAMHRDGYHSWKVISVTSGGNTLSVRTFFAADGSNTDTKYGVGAESRVFNPQTRKLEIRFNKRSVGSDGGKAAGDDEVHQDGYTFAEVHFDGGGRALEEAYFDRHHERVVTRKGYARVTREFDPATGKFKGEMYWVLDLKGGYARVADKRDARGRLLERAWFDPDGKPVADPGGVARVTWRYDGRGFETECAQYDPAGRSVVRGGFARRTAVPDARGRWLEVAYFGSEGQPMLYRGGYHLRRVRYDKDGRPVEVSFFGLDGRPVAHDVGCHKAATRYDLAKGRVEVSFFGPDGRPAAQAASGRARLVRQGKPGSLPLVMEAWGHQESFGAGDFWGLDAAGNYLSGRRTWSKDGLEVTDAYFDESGRAAVHQHGYHKMVARLNVQQLPTERACFGLEGRPAVHRDGYHRMTFHYSGRQESERACWAADGKRCLHRDGYHRLTRQAAFTSQGRPKLTADGHHLREQRFDTGNRLLEESYFGNDGWPCLPPKQGFHQLRNRYDAAGHRVAWSFFGVDGRPVRHPDGNHRGTARFDDAGHEVEWAFWDVDGKPVLLTAGYHKWTAKYDASGRRTEEAYFDTAGRPAMHKDFYSRFTYAYDADGKLTARTPWVLDYRGAYARIAQKRDARGRLIEQAYFTADGKPTHHPHGDHKYVLGYDGSGREVERSYFDEQGKLVVGANGYARVRQTFDTAGHWTDVALFDAAAKPLPVQTFVRSVTVGGLAARLGLKAEDVLESYGGAAVVNPARFLEGRRVEPADGRIRALRVRRGATVLTLSVPPGDLGMMLDYRAAVSK